MLLLPLVAVDTETAAAAAPAATPTAAIGATIVCSYITLCIQASGLGEASVMDVVTAAATFSVA